MGIFWFGWRSGAPPDEPPVAAVADDSDDSALSSPANEAFLDELRLLVKQTDTTTVTLSDGRHMSKCDLCTEGIHLYPSESVFYIELGLLLRPGEIVELRDGRTMNRRELFFEAVCCDMGNSDAYNNLGTSLKQSEVVIVPSGRRLDRQQCFIEALRLNPSSCAALINLSLAVRHASRRAGADTWVTLSDGRRLDARQLALEAVRVDPTNPAAYVHLASMMHHVGDIAQLSDGRSLDQQQLFMEALRYPDPQRSMVPVAFTYLANHLGNDPGAHVTLPPDGRQYTRLELYLEALEADATYADGYYYLSTFLASTAANEVVLLDGRLMDREMLYFEALKHCPSHYDAHIALAALLLDRGSSGSGEDEQCASEMRRTVVDLYLDAIRSRPKTRLAYERLAALLGPGDEVTLRDGRRMDRESLLAEVAQLSECYSVCMSATHFP